MPKARRTPSMTTKNREMSTSECENVFPTVHQINEYVKGLKVLLTVAHDRYIMSEFQPLDKSQTGESFKQH